MENIQLAYSVYGVIQNCPFNALVRAYDHDLLQNELLGQSIVNKDGSYEIKFDANDFSGKILHLEKKPDIYLRLYNEDGKCIHTTNVYKNSTGEQFRIDIILKEESIPTVAKAEGEIAVNMEQLSILKHKDMVNAYYLLLNPGATVENQEAIVKVFPKILIDGYIKLEQYDGLFRDIMLERHTPMFPNEILDGYFHNLEPDGLLTFRTEHVSVTYQEHPWNEIPGNVNHSFKPPVTINYEIPNGANQLLIGQVKASPDGFNDTVHAQYMQKIGLAAEYAYTKFMQYRFKDPLINFPDRVLIVSTPPLGAPGQQDTHRSGTTHVAFSKPVIWIVSILNDQDLFLAVVHEMFHLIQSQYHPSNFTDRVDFQQMIIEGGAKFVEDCFMDSSNSYVQFADSQIYRRNRYYIPNTNMLQPVEYSYVFSDYIKTVSYGGALFWKYLAGLYSQLPYTDPYQGIDVQKKLLEAMEVFNTGFSRDILKLFYTKLSIYGTFDSFKWSDDTNNKHLISQENAWGNYLMAVYLHSIMNVTHSKYDARFDFVEDNEVFRFGTTDIPFKSLIPPVETIELSLATNGYTTSRTINPYEAKYYQFVPPDSLSSRMLSFRFKVAVSMDTDPQPMVKIILIRKTRTEDVSPNETIQDIYQTESTDYYKYINLKNIAKIIVIVASREKPFTFHLTRNFADLSDVMITRWNSLPGKEYEINPAYHGWTWLSPDIIVDNNNDLLDDGVVYSNLPNGQANNLKIRIRNKGNIADMYNKYALEVSVQKLSPMIDSGLWQTLEIVEDIQAPEPGAEKWIEVPWIINGDGVTLEDWSVKVKIIQSYSHTYVESLDNKEAITQFAGVKPYTVPFLMKKTCKASPGKCGDLLFIPRDRTFTISKTSNPVLNKAIFNSRRSKSFSEYIRLDIEQSGSMKAWEGSAHPDFEAKGYYFPLNREVLPPGITGENMITVTQVVDGTAVGGISYRIVSEEQKIKK